MQEAISTVYMAADVYMAIYPEDLIPHPATFYQAMAAGIAVVATPFKAALAHLPSHAGRIVYSRDPAVIAKNMLALTGSSGALKDMQHSTWRASRNSSWAHAGSALLTRAIVPLMAA